MKTKIHFTLPEPSSLTTSRVNTYTDLLNLDSFIFSFSEAEERATEKDFNVFFDPSSYQMRDPDELVDFLMGLKGLSYSILDVSTLEGFTDEVISPYLVLMIAAADLVIASSSEIQEAIYEHTGRLSPIVRNPHEEDITEDCSHIDLENPRVVWFGEREDLFSLYDSSEREHLDETIVYGTMSRKEFEYKVDKADIIFLPQTFTVEREIVRIQKVKGGSKNGKLVVAPGLYEYSFAQTLEEALSLCEKDPENAFIFIRTIQEEIEEEYSWEVNSRVLREALTEVPKQVKSFLDSLDNKVSEI